VTFSPTGPLMGHVCEIYILNLVLTSEILICFDEWIIKKRSRQGQVFLVNSSKQNNISLIKMRNNKYFTCQNENKKIFHSSQREITNIWHVKTSKNCPKRSSVLTCCNESGQAVFVWTKQRMYPLLRRSLCTAASEIIDSSCTWGTFTLETHYSNFIARQLYAQKCPKYRKTQYWLAAIFTSEARASLVLRISETMEKLRLGGNGMWLLGRGGGWGWIYTINWPETWSSFWECS